jgi:hypothetical protein
MKPLLVASAVVLGLASLCIAQTPPHCSRHDSGNKYISDNRAAIHFVEVCKVPNPEGKPALSVILSSDDGDHAIRIYSNDATKPLILDGIYVERNGEKKFVLHRENIEWANGSRTHLDTVDPKKKKKLIEVFEAAFQLLKEADEFHRIPMRHSQDRLNFWRVFNFMFNYQIDGKH